MLCHQSTTCQPLKTLLISKNERTARETVETEKIPGDFSFFNHRSKYTLFPFPTALNQGRK